ncbi:hypothetical protein ACSSS7_003882 [Eimeria intestinalis]
MVNTRRPSRVSWCHPSMLGLLALVAVAVCLFAAAADAEATTAAALPQQQQKQQQQITQANEEPPCTTGLRDAINAAIVELLEYRVIANELMRTYPTVPYVPLLSCPPGSGDPSSWPAVSDLHPSDLLLDVLRKGQLRVASYGPPDAAIEQGEDRPPHQRAAHGYDWGKEGNYTEKPYKGEEATPAP